MHVKAISKNNRITIPPEILEESGVAVGQFMSIEYDKEHHRIILKPMQLVQAGKQIEDDKGE